MGRTVRSRLLSGASLSIPCRDIKAHSLSGVVAENTTYWMPTSMYSCHRILYINGLDRAILVSLHCVVCPGYQLI